MRTVWNNKWSLDIGLVLIWLGMLPSRIRFGGGGTCAEAKRQAQKRIKNNSRGLEDI